MHFFLALQETSGRILFAAFRSVVRFVLCSPFAGPASYGMMDYTWTFALKFSSKSIEKQHKKTPAIHWITGV